MNAHHFICTLFMTCTIQALDAMPIINNYEHALEQGNKLLSHFMLETTHDRLPYGITPLHLAVAFQPTISFVQSDRQLLISSLLNSGWHINQTDHYGRTPLHYLAFRQTKNRSYLVNFLASKGAQLGTQDYLRKTPLHYAATQQNPRVLEKLLFQLANNTGQAILNVQDIFGNTALHCAVLYANNDGTRLLLDRGIHTELSNANGHTALHLAVIYRKTEVLNTLLTHQTNSANINAQDMFGNTPLHTAISLQSWYYVTILLNAHAQTHIANNQGITPHTLSAGALTPIAQHQQQPVMPMATQPSVAAIHTNQQIAAQAINALTEYDQYRKEQGEKRTRDEACSICSDEEDPHLLLLELPCTHNFHTTCLEKWFAEGKQICPNCRTQVDVEALIKKISTKRHKQ